MPFNSLPFLAFALAFFALWPLARRSAPVRYAYLAGAGLFFYGFSGGLFVLVLIVSGLMAFSAGWAISRTGRHKRRLLVVALGGLVGLLVLFKYSAFIAGALDRILAIAGISAGFEARVPAFLLALPLGISFFTFEALSYVIDVYAGRLVPTRNPLHFFAYFSLFPNLASGPIARGGEILPQLAQIRRVDESARFAGLQLIGRGFFKKLVLADQLTNDISAAFSAATPSNSALYWWGVTLGYALFIYFDFSGYTDIARGLGLWIGLDLPENFNHPYSATSVTHFWTRWHISLSAWLRDYLFLPLSIGLSRRFPRGKVLGLRADLLVYSVITMVTMELCGLWHGPAWTFVLWGCLHGLFMIIERITGWPKRLLKLPMGRVAAWLLTLTQVGVAWIFFRAESFTQGIAVLGRMFGFGGGWEWPFAGPANVALAAGAAAVVFTFSGWAPLAKAPPRWRERVSFIALALMLAAAILLRGSGKGFVYFRF